MSNGLKVTEKNLPVTKVACTRVIDVRCVSYHHNDRIKMVHEIMIGKRQETTYRIHTCITKKFLIL